MLQINEKTHGLTVLCSCLRGGLFLPPDMLSSVVGDRERWRVTAERVMIIIQLTLGEITDRCLTRTEPSPPLRYYLGAALVVGHSLPTLRGHL